MRGGWKSVEGVVEGCTPRNVKNKMLGYVFGEYECAEATISEV